MTDAVKKSVSGYLKAVKRALVGNAEENAKVLLSLESDVYDYIEEHPGVGIGELKQHFGTPEQVADAQVAGMEPETLRKKAGSAPAQKMGDAGVAVAAGLRRGRRGNCRADLCGQRLPPHHYPRTRNRHKRAEWF